MAIERVLLVDDDAEVAAIGALCLQHVAKWEVLCASSGPEALEIASREHVDVAVVDVRMPGMDGPAMLAELRKDPKTMGLPVIFMTASAHPSLLEALLAAGAAGVISKPYRPLALAEQIRDILAGSTG